VLAEYLDSGACERHLRGLQLSCEQQVERMRQVAIWHFPAAARMT